jgi:hypothetical protein
MPRACAPVHCRLRGDEAVPAGATPRRVPDHESLHASEYILTAPYRGMTREDRGAPALRVVRR